MKITLSVFLACFAAGLSWTPRLRAAPAPPVLRADQPNAVEFTPQEARFVRFVIHASSDGEPCLDELEIFGPDPARNLAPAGGGAKATASSCLTGYAIHQIAHLNDGLYGNGHSWVASSASGEWAQIELPGVERVSRVVFSRDREGQFADRVPVTYEVRLSLDGAQWTAVAEVKNAKVAGQAPRGTPSYEPPAPLPDPVTHDGLVRYAMLCERATWSRMNATDHLSPLRREIPYWSRIARMDPLARTMVQFEEMIARLASKGVDTSAEARQLASLRSRLAKAGERAADDNTLYLDARLAKRRLLFRDPDLAPLERILYVKRHPYLSSHNYSDILDSQFKSGGGICVLEMPRTDGRLEPAQAKVTTLFDGSGGIARDPVADFEARTIYFAFRPDKASAGEQEPYWHLMAMKADGTGLRRLTGGPFHDYYPCPLPDGGLAFISTRCKARFLCWRPQAFVLFRMDADASPDSIRPLSFANLSEWTPAVMRDGRLLWTRSEYVDKGADFGHSLWAIRPDGTHPELVFGNNMPNCFIAGREMPGASELLCTIFSHGGDHNGPLGLIDLSRAAGPSDPAAILNLTPDSAPHYNMNWPRQECWRDPVPVSRDYFLASHAPADRFGLFVADRWGNRELLHLDPDIGSMSPSLLRPEPRPPALPPRAPEVAEAGMGQFTVANVHEGLGPEVRPGTVKYIRVCEEVRAGLERLPGGEYRRDHGPDFQDFYATPVHKVHGPFGWPSYVAKSVIGLAPVESDGSANFYAPAGKVLYFQALDGNLNEVQRMRSVVQLQPGERRGCIGCHESRQAAPPPDVSLAALRPARRLKPPPWGAVPFSYERVVQPVWNAHCVRCHDAGDARGMILTAALDADKVPASYRTLIAGGWVHYFDMTWSLQHHKAAPRTFGTVRSKLIALLESGHHGTKLARDEMHAVKCWIDLNCPLWPDYTPRDSRPRPQTTANGISGSVPTTTAPQ